MKNLHQISDTEILARASQILERRAKYNVKRDIFSSPECVERYLVLKMEAMNDGSEHFTVLYLNNRNGLITCETPFHGTIDSAAVYPREIVKRAIHHNAAAVIFAHNHPSGNPNPSKTDLLLTAKLIAACKLIDVRVVDHIITANATSRTYSLAANGQLITDELI